LFELETGTILFARPLCEDGKYDEKDDIAVAWCIDGCIDLPFISRYFLTLFRNAFLANDEVNDLDEARDSLLGPSDKMTAGAPVNDPQNPGHLIGGTAFERCGQNPVKGSGRCYSLTMTHQRQWALVGLTAGGKHYEDIEGDDRTLNLEIREKVIKVICLFAFQ